MRAGAGWRVKSCYGCTAYEIAYYFNGFGPVLKALLDLCADVNSRSDDGYTPLMYALEDNYRTGVVQMLLSYGADAYAKDIDGQTAFDIAAENCPESLNDFRMASRTRGQT